MFNWLSRYLRKPKPPLITRVPIAGLKYYRAVELSTLMHRGDELSLEHEANNPHDPDAVMIFWQGNKIGYIPSQYAKHLHELLEQHQNISGNIVEIDPEAGESRWVKLNVYPK